jgi:hypothetical protein
VTSIDRTRDTSRLPREPQGSSYTRHFLFVCGERVEDLLPNPLFGGGVDDGPTEGESATVAILELTGWKRDVSGIAASKFPDAEPDQSPRISHMSNVPVKRAH